MLTILIYFIAVCLFSGLALLIDPDAAEWASMLLQSWAETMRMLQRSSIRIARESRSAQWREHQRAWAYWKQERVAIRTLRRHDKLKGNVPLECTPEVPGNPETGETPEHSSTAFA